MWCLRYNLGVEASMRPKESLGERPVWSVLGGEFIPDIAIDGELIGKLADVRWRYSPKDSAYRTIEQARDCVNEAFILCGMTAPGIAHHIHDATGEFLVDQKQFDFAKRSEVVRATPELDQQPDEDQKYATISPVMNMLRLLIDRCNNDITEIKIDDQIFDNPERWRVHEDTKELAEAVIRRLYLEEQYQHGI